ncbi:MAG TPA: NIPSNAP family protein [Myxococcota bacterium]|nr:NIPSNAP family protein [Myxococcota bacterium]
MHEIYEQRRFRVGPGEWAGQVERLRGPAGAAFFGAFRGQIGLEANEGILLTVYPDAAKLALSVGALRAASAAARDVRTERMVATVRPTQPAAPTRPGVYAFRTFEIRDTDSAEFASLSERAWPGFEASYDVEIIGLWKSLDLRAPEARFHLLTRYASLATWEASRADAGRPEFARRHELTRRTWVVTTTLA